MVVQQIGSNGFFWGPSDMHVYDLELVGRKRMHLCQYTLTVAPFPRSTPVKSCVSPLALAVWRVKSREWVDARPTTQPLTSSNKFVVSA